MGRDRLPNVSMTELMGPMRSSYSATKTDVLNRSRTGLAPMGASADYHIRNEQEYFKFVEMAWDVDRNDVVVGQAINRLVSNVVQQGFPVDPQTGNPELDAAILDRFQNWGQNKRECHFGQTLDWLDIQRLTFRSTLVAGDHINLLTNRGCIDSVENYRMRTPTGTARNVIFGVKKDDNGIPQECWLTKLDINPNQALRLVGDVRRCPIWDENGNLQVLHSVMRRRVSQTRGVTVLAPTFRAIGLHDDIEYAELVKRQVASCIAFLREVPIDSVLPPGTMGEVETQQNGTGSATRLIQQLYPGMDVVGNPGEKLTAFTGGGNASDFVSHALLVLTFIAINLDLPVHVLLLDPSKTNFSGWRGAIEQARIRWRDMQDWLINNLHRPVYEWLIRRWMLGNDALGKMLRKAGGDGASLMRHAWHPPGWAYIEPLKDAQADALRQVSLLSSPRRILGSLQLDHTRIVDETIEDHEYEIVKALQAADRIKAKFNVDVDWHEFLGKSLPTGVTMSLTSTGDQAIAEQQAAKVGSTNANN